ncbi:MAG: aa3-type cytochrome c oxidase subunit IV [Rhizobiaceae bacterium]
MAKKAKSSTPANAMDYPEHEKTYNAFVGLIKWGTVGCVALMIAMAFGFFAGGGLLGGTLLMIILLIISYFAI